MGARREFRVYLVDEGEADLSTAPPGAPSWRCASTARAPWGNQRRRVCRRSPGLAEIQPYTIMYTSRVPPGGR